MVELGAQSITYELAIIVYMVSVQDPPWERGPVFYPQSPTMSKRHW